MKYNIEKAKKEEDELKEKKRIREEKERETQRLREKQEKANDKLAEMAIIKAKKAYEQNIEELNKTIKNKDLEIEHITNKYNEIKGQIDGYKAEVEKAQKMAEEAKNKYDELTRTLEEDYKKKNEALEQSFNEKTNGK